MAKLSVIVPVYNVKEYLTACVESILFQTFTDWELLLVDDGSRDGSAGLCDELAKGDSRIRVIHQENGGVSSARNAGIAAATGELLAFVDADDFIHPRMYEKLMNAMTGECDIVFCRFVRSYEDRTVYHRETQLEALAKTPWDYSRIIYEFHFAQTQGQTEADTVFGSAWRSLFRRDIVTENGISFPEGIALAEDRLFLMAYLRHCRTGSLVDEYLYYYRADRQDSATGAAGHQPRLYEKKKALLSREIPLIRENPHLKASVKQELITYERYRMALDITLNEILYHPDYRLRLKRFFREEPLRGSVCVKAFCHMKKTGVPAKRMALYALIGLRWWDAIAGLLNSRRRQK